MAVGAAQLSPGHQEHLLELSPLSGFSRNPGSRASCQVPVPEREAALSCQRKARGLRSKHGAQCQSQKVGENRCKEGKRVLDRRKEAISDYRKTGVSVTHGTKCCPGTVAAQEYSGQFLQSEKCRKPALRTANPEWGYGRAQVTASPMDTALVATLGHRAGPACRGDRSGGRDCEEEQNTLRWLFHFMGTL